MTELTPTDSGSELMKKLNAVVPLPDTLPEGETWEGHARKLHELAKEGLEFLTGLFAVRNMKLTVKPGDINLELDTQIASIFASTMHAMFLRSEAVNYVEWSFTHSEEEDGEHTPLEHPYILHLQAATKPTPHQLRAQAEEKLFKLESVFKHLPKDTWEEHRNQRVVMVNKHSEYVGRLVRHGEQWMLRELIMPEPPATEAIIRDHLYQPEARFDVYLLVSAIERNKARDEKDN